MLSAPSIADFADQDVTLGSDATFACVASGSPPFTYEWVKDGVALALPFGAAFGERLTIVGATNDDEGDYACRVTNPVGEDASSEAQG